MLEKFLIFGYSSYPFLLFNILSKLIWYLSTTYTASLRSLASSCTYTGLTGLISSLLDWVLYQYCCNCNVTISLLQIPVPPCIEMDLKLQRIWVISWNIKFCLLRNICNVSLLLSKCSYRTNMFFLKFLTSNNLIFSSTYSFTKNEKKTKPKNP